VAHGKGGGAPKSGALPMLLLSSSADAAGASLREGDTRLALASAPAGFASRPAPGGRRGAAGRGCRCAAAALLP
jgi:hypothetical protein